jgi:hypothetical protein
LHDRLGSGGRCRIVSGSTGSKLGR